MNASYNPVWVELATSYAKAKEYLSEKNAYLASIVEEVRIGHTSKRGTFGYQEAKAMMQGFYATYATERIICDEDFDHNPQLFWELGEFFKSEGSAIGSRGLHGLRYFYRHLQKKGVFSDTFRDADKSPIEHLKRGCLSDFMENEFTSAENTFVIKYSRTAKTYLLALNFQSKIIQHAAVVAIEKSRRISERSKEDMAIAKESETWFGPHASDITEYVDFTAARLTYAISYIKEHYNGRAMEKAMNFLFDMYAAIIREHPRHDFFADSFLWNSQIILDQRVPIQICHGYQLVAMGRVDDLPGYEKVLFCARNADRLSANGHRFGMHAYDLSGIKSEFYRKIVVNFGAANFSVGIDRSASFLKWLESTKHSSQRSDINEAYITREEMVAYRAHITSILREPESRNRRIGGARKLIYWAVSAGYLQIEDGALNDFISFRTVYKPNQHCLSRHDIDAIDLALEELGKKDVRCYLARYIFRIQLFVDTRAGELCAMALDRLRFKPDGTSAYESMEKNGGKEMIRIKYSKAATRVILEAIDATRALRATCPIDGPSTCLFLYDSGPTWGHGFKVMGTDTYNRALADACAWAKIQKYTSGNVRDTYMSAVARFGHKHGLTELQKAILTKHATKVSTRHYIDINLDEFLKAADGLVLGTIR